MDSKSASLQDQPPRPSGECAVVNVVCLKWGTLYGPEYVNKLLSMVSRHLHRPFRFICLTDDETALDADIEVFPLPDFEEPPWEFARYCSAWRKLALFRSGLANMQGKVLFLDLDVVIVDAIDCFFDCSSKFAMIENWYQPGRQVGQASVMCFEAGREETLLRSYERDPLPFLRRYGTEQAYISGELGAEGCEFFPSAWCQSYKLHCMPKGLRKFWQAENVAPAGSKILVFHGRPNPPDAIAGRWGKDFPWYKRWYKRISPSPWLAEHWC